MKDMLQMPKQSSLVGGWSRGAFQKVGADDEDLGGGSMWMDHERLPRAGASRAPGEAGGQQQRRPGAQKQNGLFCREGELGIGQASP